MSADDDVARTIGDQPLSLGNRRSYATRHLKVQNTYCASIFPRVTTLAMRGEELLAHGVGSREDLPLSLPLVLIGAGAALVVSFLALAVLWREPRLDKHDRGLLLPPWMQRVLDSRWLRGFLRAVGMVLTSYVVLAAVAGRDDALNPTPGVVYVLLWIGVPLLSVVLGPVWRLVNPLRTVHYLISRLLRVSPRRGVLLLPARVGYWPAAASLLAFVWLELVAADRATLPVLRTFFAFYAAVHLIGAACFGSRWFDRADGFEVYSTLAGRLSPFGRRRDGRLALRNPLVGLASTRPAAGLYAVVGVLLGSTAYDSLSNAPWWVSRVQSSAIAPRLLETAGLTAAVAVVTAAFAGAAALSGRVALAPSCDTRSTGGEFAHTIVPIVVGYVIAHYWTVLVLVGQATVVQLSDPLGTGANWLGTADRGVDATLARPGFVAGLQVSAIVIGHVLAVVLAHERAVRLYPARRAAAGQVPLMVLMLMYTIGGLSLLFAT